MKKLTTRTAYDQASQGIPDFIHLIEKQGEKTEVKLENLTIQVPKEDRTLIEEANIVINAGERFGFTGPNGSGKSSLFRAARGLDSDGKGKISLILPEGKDIFCASQEIRKIPITLPGLLAYPHAPEDHNRAEYESVLSEAGLGHIHIHLPWNAVQPDNILKILTPLLQQALDKYAGSLTPYSARKFKESFHQVLADKLSVPNSLAEYYTPDIHTRTVNALVQRTSEILAPAAGQPGNSLFFASRSGKKIAKAFAENAKSVIDGWLLQGHRIRLSGGEQQRLIFARMFLQGKDIAIFLLDEVTSAMKQETAHEMYEKLIRKFPDATIIGIIHDESLLAHFTHHMQLGTDKKLHVKPLMPSPETYPRVEYSPEN